MGSRWHSRNRPWTASSSPCSAPRPAMRRAWPRGWTFAGRGTAGCRVAAQRARIGWQRGTGTVAGQSAVERAAAAPGHHGRRTPAAGRQRQHRRGARGVLPEHLADRQHWQWFERTVQPVRQRHPRVELPAEDHPADLPGRQAARQPGHCQRRPRYRAGAVREIDPGRLPRNRRRACAECQPG
ncbi:hypothetical protein G6F55_013643 [Rhizopus delemar]|nr:hypothetical protein G6F55_013643 [Rhizopus delemar]